MLKLSVPLNVSDWNDINKMERTIGDGERLCSPINAYE